eukprot:CAMPEP_0115001612 /NCGR_PEP_ID=MMETSP0216-20121206/17487_1 /TAXON_ID=223996 /ORGANISM="Protocruzia adherens, Strain Boccale" /LENGTH=337 /DNA_ID=CAMNT_0002366995 /DNA_START=231 /DNA_END=1244 /DNA_ORIENTATION=+
MTEIYGAISPPSNGFKPEVGRGRSRRASKKVISSTRIRLILAASNNDLKPTNSSDPKSNSWNQRENTIQTRPSLFDCVKKVWGREGVPRSTFRDTKGLESSRINIRSSTTPLSLKLQKVNGLKKRSTYPTELEDLDFVEEFDLQEDTTSGSSGSSSSNSGLNRSNGSQICPRGRSDLRKITACAGLKDVERKWSKPALKEGSIIPHTVLPKRFLIIDDDPVNHTILKMIARGKGNVEFEHAYNGQEGIRAIKRSLKTEGAVPFDGIFLDFHLPDLLGDRVCRNIRQIYKDHRALPVKIIGHSSCTAVEREDLWEAGIDEFMEKPTTSQHFARILALS